MIINKGYIIKHTKEGVIYRASTTPEESTSEEIYNAIARTCGVLVFLIFLIIPIPFTGIIGFFIVVFFWQYIPLLLVVILIGLLIQFPSEIYQYIAMYF